MLLIKILYEYNYLIIFVEDNGIGRKQSAKLSQNSTGIGLKVYKEFFEISNKFNSQKAGFEITDLEDPQGEALGTKVKVFLPVNYKFSM